MPLVSRGEVWISDPGFQTGRHKAPPAPPRLPENNPRGMAQGDQTKSFPCPLNCVDCLLREKCGFHNASQAKWPLSCLSTFVYDSKGASFCQYVWQPKGHGNFSYLQSRLFGGFPYGYSRKRSPLTLTWALAQVKPPWDRELHLPRFHFGVPLCLTHTSRGTFPILSRDASF